MDRPYKLVYISRAATNLSAEELYDIIKVSNRNNSKLDITGILLFKSGMFLQVLEGPKDEIVDIYYNVIEKDTRHCDPQVVVEGFDNKRNFPGWHMHPNTFDSESFVTDTDIENDSELGILKIVKTFDLANY